jgi:predicted oxidoreductase (fatty acid repression mutant protein)
MEILFALALVATTDGQDVQYRAGDAALEICGVSADNPVKLIEKVLALPETTFIEQTEEYLTIFQAKHDRFWTLVINEHRAAPAIICRTFESDGRRRTNLDMQLSCFAEKADCDKLTADFVAHNNKIMAEAKQK